MASYQVQCQSSVDKLPPGEAFETMSVGKTSTEDKLPGKRHLSVDSSDDGMVSTTNSELQYQDTSGLQGAAFKGKPVKDKLCSVCGDKALGYNFNAVSCESCKAFFRRNAGKTFKGRCEGKCEVTVESRSYCKKCRLAKCFKVGMKKDLILNESQKQLRRQKIEENRLRRQGLPVPPPSQSSDTQASPSNTSDGCEESNSSKHVFTPDIDLTLLVNLNDNAKTRISEVMRAFQLSFDSPVTYDPKQTPINSTEFLNMADLSVRRLVKMSKHLSSFRVLDQEDQISLLKGAVVEVLILRSTKMFDAAQMAWSLKKDGEERKVSAIAFQFGTGADVHFFEQYQRFTMGVLKATQRDPVVLMLMIVIAVFSPDRPNLACKERVFEIQDEYAGLLREYCTTRFPSDLMMLPKVLQKLTDIREINETHTKMLMHMRVDELGPLIVEIFNLSSQ